MLEHREYLEKKIWKKIQQKNGDECWEWQGGKTSSGYGYVRVYEPGNSKQGKKSFTASRVVWSLENNQEIPAGMYVCHKCDNPACCRPDHLFLGTPRDNAQDCLKKGRMKNCFIRETNTTRKIAAAGGVNSRTSLKKRFMEKVTNTPCGCCEWMGKATKDGYGAVSIIEGGKRKVIVAHRVSWKMFYGPIPDGMMVCHKCDNRKCVRPGHLFLGTAKDNARDCVFKKRNTSQQYPERVVRGSRHGNAVLTEETASCIIKEYMQGDITQHHLASKYKLSQSAISLIISGELPLP